jgi:hypothetical protein
MPGRVGEAAIYGSGVWTESIPCSGVSSAGVGCSLSGMGEQVNFNFSVLLTHFINSKDHSYLVGT